MSDKIKPCHLARKAMLYVRQSSPSQLERNPESRRLQPLTNDESRPAGIQERPGPCAYS